MNRQEAIDQWCRKWATWEGPYPDEALDTMWLLDLDYPKETHGVQEVLLPLSDETASD